MPVEFGNGLLHYTVAEKIGERGMDAI